MRTTKHLAIAAPGAERVLSTRAARSAIAPAATDERALSFARVAGLPRAATARDAGGAELTIPLGRSGSERFA